MSGVHRTFLGLVLVLTVIPGWRLLATLHSQQVMMEQVIPAEAEAGSVVTVTGYALDPAHIQEMYLLSEMDDAYRVEVLSESGTSLRFRVPQNAPAGRMRIAVKAPDKAGLIEQMIELRIVGPSKE
jgi:hypothetical protein